MPKHGLPGEGGSDWFDRLNRFEQVQTRRQVEFKRSTWPSLEDGSWSKRPDHSYPHILPVGHIDKAFFPPVAHLALEYLTGSDIALHSEILNLRSSQAACLNILFPLKLNLELAVTVLAPLLPSVRRVTDIEFEYTGPDLATAWLGEPPDGKRGQNRTSIDAAIWWEDFESCNRLTLVEFKYTERQLGGCGGYASKANPDPETCRSLDLLAGNPEGLCYVAGRSSPRTSRRYWEHLEEAGISLDRLADIPGCPFIGPFNQIMRQFLLAAYFRKDEFGLDEVDVAVLSFEGNDSLVQVPTELATLGPDIVSAWNTALAEVPKLRKVSVHQLAYEIPQTNQDWKKYLGVRYGI